MVITFFVMIVNSLSWAGSILSIAVCDLVVEFQVDKLKEAALCALHALSAICALGDNWRAWRA
jgi:hypothetical protein